MKIFVIGGEAKSGKNTFGELQNRLDMKTADLKAIIKSNFKKLFQRRII